MVTEKFKEIVKEIKKTGNGVEMTIRQFLWLFDESQKRTSGNVWRIREYLKEQKLITIPDFIEGVIDNPIFLVIQMKILILFQEFQILKQLIKFLFL